jgi:L-methionine (R)-S-oxide reductase
MADIISVFEHDSKEEKYKALFPQIQALIEPETDLVANLSNIAAALTEVFGWLWTGFYLVKDDELVLGPFQGPVACTRIGKGKGVCGTAWSTGAVQLVPNVEEFDGYISCSSYTRSEVVIPLFHNAQVVGVLDIDSEKLDDFDAVDVRELSKICRLIETKWA